VRGVSGGTDSTTHTPISYVLEVPADRTLSSATGPSTTSRMPTGYHRPAFAPSHCSRKARCASVTAVPSASLGTTTTRGSGASSRAV
jgi:hypothetical protein